MAAAAPTAPPVAPLLAATTPVAPATAPPAPVSPITAQFPQATLDQLKAQGIPVDGGSLLQVQDGRAVLVVGPQAQEAAARQQTMNLVYGGLAVLAVVALLVYTLGPGRTPEPGPEPVAAGEQDEKGSLSAQLDKIAQLIEEGKAGQALRKLESGEEEFGRYPELSDRADELRVQAEAAQLLSTARKYEREGDKITALKTYREVLGQDAANAEARRRIAALYPELKPDQGFAVITIRATPVTAEASLDGRSLGSTPVEVPLHAGKYTLALSAEGFAPLQTALSVASVKDQAYDYQLSPKGAATSTPQTPTKPPGGGTGKKPTGSGTKPPEGPTKPRPTPKTGGEDDLIEIPMGKKR